MEAITSGPVEQHVFFSVDHVDHDPRYKYCDISVCEDTAPTESSTTQSSVATQSSPDGEDSDQMMGVIGDSTRIAESDSSQMFTAISASVFLQLFFLDLFWIWICSNNMGLSENSVPLNPMVNDPYPY